MNFKERTAKKIVAASLLRGDFLLRSGARSPIYFDKYRFESQPALLNDVTELMRDLIPRDTELLAGLEMGGIPLAVSISLTTLDPVVFVRKTAKSYGTCQAVEGADVKGRRVCVIEDVLTSGGAVLLALEELRRQGADVISVVCAINRSADPAPVLAGVQVRSVFTMADLEPFMGQP